MALANGTRLGPYELIAMLGVGGMGEVYRARDTRLDRTVAIKILPARFSLDPVRKQRFEREAKTVSSLNHPHMSGSGPFSRRFASVSPSTNSIIR